MRLFPPPMARRRAAPLLRAAFIPRFRAPRLRRFPATTMTTPAPAPAPAPAPSLSSSSSVFCPQSLAIPITFPAFPPAAGDVHAFASPAVEKRVFTHRSAATATTTYASFSHASGSAARWRDDNEHLEFVGDMVLKGLTGMLIDELFPNADEGYMSVGSHPPSSLPFPSPGIHLDIRRQKEGGADPGMHRHSLRCC